MKIVPSRHFGNRQILFRPNIYGPQTVYRVFFDFVGIKNRFLPLNDCRNDEIFPLVHRSRNYLRGKKYGRFYVFYECKKWLYAWQNCKYSQLFDLKTKNMIEFINEFPLHRSFSIQSNYQHNRIDWQITYSHKKCWVIGPNHNQIEEYNFFFFFRKSDCLSQKITKIHSVTSTRNPVTDSRDMSEVVFSFYHLFYINLT